MDIAGRKVDIVSIQVDGVDSNDYPDFCDAYFSYALYEDGGELSDDDLEELTDKYGDVVHVMAYDSFT